MIFSITNKAFLRVPWSQEEGITDNRLEVEGSRELFLGED